MAQLLADLIYPVGTAAFYLIAMLLPMTFPDHQRWRYLLVGVCLSLGTFSLLLAASTSSYAVLEFEATRLYIRIVYGCAITLLLPFMAVYFRRTLELRVDMWWRAVRARLQEVLDDARQDRRNKT